MGLQKYYGPWFLCLPCLMGKSALGLNLPLAIHAIPPFFTFYHTNMPRAFQAFTHNIPNTQNAVFHALLQHYMVLYFINLTYISSPPSKRVTSLVPRVRLGLHNSFCIPQIPNSVKGSFHIYMNYTQYHIPTQRLYIEAIIIQSFDQETINEAIKIVLVQRQHIPYCSICI